MNSDEIDELLRGAQGTPPPDAIKEKIMNAAQAALDENVVVPVRNAKRSTPGRTVKAAVSESIWTRLGALNVAALLMLAAMGGYFVYYYVTNVHPQQNGETAKGPDGDEHRLPFAANEPPATTEEKAKIAELIGKLSHDNFDTREQALQALIAMGPKALPQLRAAAGKDADSKALLLKATRQIEHNYAAAEIEKRWPGMVKQFLAHSKINPFGEQPPGPSHSDWLKSLDKREAAPVLVELYALLQPGPELNLMEFALNRMAYSGTVVTLDWDFMELRGRQPIEVLEQPDSTIEQSVSPKARELIVAKLKPAVPENGMVVFGGPSIFYRDLSALGVRLVLTPKPSRRYLLHSEAAAYWREWLAGQQRRLDWQPGDNAAPTAENVNRWAATLDDKNDAPLAIQRLIGAWANPETQAALKNGVKQRSTTATNTLKQLETLVQSRRSGRLLAMEDYRPVTLNLDGTEITPLFTGEFDQSGWVSLGVHAGVWYLTVYGEKIEGLYQWTPQMSAPRRILTKVPRRAKWVESRRQLWCLQNENPASLVILDENGAPQPVPEALKGKFINYEVSPDGRQVACIELIDQQYHCSIFDFASAQVKTVQKGITADETSLAQASWSDSGSYAVFTVSQPRPDVHVATQLWLYDVKSGSIRDIFQPGWIATMVEWAGDSIVLLGSPFKRGQMQVIPPPFTTAASVAFPAGVAGEWLESTADGPKLNGIIPFNVKTLRFEDARGLGRDPQQVKLGAAAWTVSTNVDPAGQSWLEWRAPDGTILPVTPQFKNVSLIRYADANWTGWKK